MAGTSSILPSVFSFLKRQRHIPQPRLSSTSASWSLPSAHRLLPTASFPQGKKEEESKAQAPLTSLLKLICGNSSAQESTKKSSDQEEQPSQSVSYSQFHKQHQQETNRKTFVPSFLLSIPILASFFLPTAKCDDSCSTNSTDSSDKTSDNCSNSDVKLDNCPPIASLQHVDSSKCGPPCNDFVAQIQTGSSKQAGAGDCSSTQSGCSNSSCRHCNQQPKCGCQQQKCSGNNNPPITTPKRNGKEPLKWCENTNLSHPVLVRQACQLTVDSVTRLLCETLSAYEDYHHKYRCLLNTMIDALEETRTTRGVNLEILDCKIMMLRAEIDHMKTKIVELESFLCTVKKMSDATAETAFLGHAEYASVAMSERLDSVIKEMKCIKEQTASMERDMVELQSLIIVESGRGLK